jgi:DNA-binding MarR family transcriptional regulator/N-acetylglutamate synthase-like GNAT family acetyltransferase
MGANFEAAQVATIRAFNRFYTRRIGVLRESLLDSPFTLAQARVLFEIGTRGTPTSGEINGELRLDPGYLSRILRKLVAKRLVSRRRSPADRRRVHLSLTAKGEQAFAELDQGARTEASAMLAALPAGKRARVMSSMNELQDLLSDACARAPDAVRIRTHGIGDVGWAIERHARLYADEYGWNEEFEALVATLFARFASRHDAARERFWVAELNDERVGCVFVVQNDTDPAAAQLRCLLVEPDARGHGIGRRLVDECIAFARSAGYRRIVLWTNDVLGAARRIYEATGFELISSEAHHSFGHDLVGQTWSKELQ